jgi:hypothetical protein
MALARGSLLNIKEELGKCGIFCREKCTPKGKRKLKETTEQLK